MTIVLPQPVPLEMPPEDVAALDELVRTVTLAGYRQEVVGDGLAGPAASAPGWLGDDAVAAGAQVAGVLELTRGCQNALLRAATRLRAHAEVLGQTRAGVARLRAEQESDFAAAWRRLGSEVNYQPAAVTDSPALLAIADEVRSADQGRRTRHAGLLEDLAADAAATARVLTESSAVVGGRARRGDTSEVILALADRLPGWGDDELAGLGRALAVRLYSTPLDGAGLDASAAGMALFADRPPFAEALLVGLGPKGVRALLGTLGRNLLGPVNSLSQVLATAMAAAAGAGSDGALDQVLHAGYVLPSAEDDDAVAAGMGMVLLAGSRGPSGGVPTGTVAEWVRQLLVLERDRNRFDSIAAPIGSAAPVDDPVGIAVGVLAERHAVDSCAQLLADPDVWQTALAHSWGDGGVGLAGVIATAGQAAGLAGDAVVRTGLMVIGQGLPLGEPVHWTVNRVTVGQIRSALGAALAAHIGVALHAMGAADEGWLNDSQLAVLRGIGNVSVDGAASAAIGQALAVSSVASLVSGSRHDEAVVLPAVLGPAAWIAVQEYGRRLDFALHGFEQQENAVARAALWDHSYGAIPRLIPGTTGVFAGMGMTCLARWVGTDGRWSNGTVEGRALGPGDALGAVLAAAGRQAPATASIDERVRQVYEHIRAALGTPVPPTSPDISLGQALLEGIDPTDVLTRNPKAHLRPGRYMLSLAK